MSRGLGDVYKRQAKLTKYLILKQVVFYFPKQTVQLFDSGVQNLDTTIQYLDIKKHLPASQMRGAIVDLST